MIHIHIGIDPGKTGFLAILDGGRYAAFATPTIAAAKGNKTQYDEAGMARILSSMCPRAAVFAVVEKQQAFPKQGGASNFTTGYGYGLWVGILSALCIPFQAVHPTTWKKAMLRDQPGDDQKVRSVLAAQQLFPQVDFRRTPQCRKPDHNMAEAFLLAEYGRRLRSGG